MKTLIRKIGERLNENFESTNSLEILNYSKTINSLLKKSVLSGQNSKRPFCENFNNGFVNKNLKAI